MAYSSSFGLKDPLSPKPHSNSLCITKRMKPLGSSTTSFVVQHDQNHEMASLESNASFSPFSMSLNLVGKEKEELESRKDNGNYLGKEIEDNKNKQVANRKCFPPPISCLTKVKVGKSIRYQTYDKESGTYVVEEIKIPNGSLFHASREDGRLKLSMNFENEKEESKKS